MSMSHMPIVPQPDRPSRLSRAVFVIALLIVWVLMGWAMAGSAIAAPSRAPYQKARTTDCLPELCELRFGKVGKKRRVHVDSVSCYLASDSQLEITSAQLLVGKTIAHSLAPVLVGKGSAQPSYALNHRTNIVARTGKLIRIRVTNAQQADGLDDLSCKIAGTVVSKR